MQPMALEHSEEKEKIEWKERKMRNNGQESRDFRHIGGTKVS